MHRRCDGRSFRWGKQLAGNYYNLDFTCIQWHVCSTAGCPACNTSSTYATRQAVSENCTLGYYLCTYIRLNSIVQQLCERVCRPRGRRRLWCIVEKQHLNPGLVWLIHEEINWKIWFWPNNNYRLFFFAVLVGWQHIQKLTATTFNLACRPIHSVVDVVGRWCIVCKVCLDSGLPVFVCEIMSLHVCLKVFSYCDGCEWWTHSLLNPKVQNVFRFYFSLLKSSMDEWIDSLKSLA